VIQPITVNYCVASSPAGSEGNRKLSCRKRSASETQYLCDVGIAFLSLPIFFRFRNRTMYMYYVISHLYSAPPFNGTTSEIRHDLCML